MVKLVTLGELKNWGGGTMKLITIILTTFLATQAWATDLSEKKAMEVMIANSGQIKVYNQTGKTVKFYKNLSEILATHMLANNHLSAGIGSYVILTNTSLSCNEPDGALGSLYMRCQLNLGDGDYIKNDLSYEGPELESTLLIQFTIRYSNVTGEYSIVGSRALVEFFG